MSKHVPAGWQVKPLEKIASTRTGKMNPLVDDKIKYIGLEHIDNGAITINGYMWSDATASLNSLFKKDDILFGKLRPYLRKCIQIGFDGCCSGELLVLKANCESANQNYLKCVLQSDPIYTFCDELSAGTKMPRVSWGDLKEFEVVLPPLTEQRKIAAILSSADRSIAATEKLIAKLADLKKALMQQLLTKGIGHAEFKPSPLGPIPKSWIMKNIGDIAKIKTGGKDTQNKVDSGQYPFYVRSQTVERINTYSFDGEGILTAGDGVGVGKVFHYVNGKFDYHQRVYNIHGFDNSVLGLFLFYYFKENFIERVKTLSAKNSVDSVRMDMISEMYVPLPPLSEQKKIAGILHGVDRKLSAAKVKLAKAKELKQGLMNDLLTGNVRVSA